jgi:hypothetical protein
MSRDSARLRVSRGAVHATSYGEARRRRARASRARAKAGARDSRLGTLGSGLATMWHGRLPFLQDHCGRNPGRRRPLRRSACRVQGHQPSGAASPADRAQASCCQLERFEKRGRQSRWRNGTARRITSCAEWTCGSGLPHGVQLQRRCRSDCVPHSPALARWSKVRLAPRVILASPESRAPNPEPRSPEAPSPRLRARP